MEADIRRAWKDDPILNRTIFVQPKNINRNYMKPKALSGGGGGSRTPVRRDLRLGAYMFIPVRF